MWYFLSVFFRQSGTGISVPAAHHDCTDEGTANNMFLRAVPRFYEKAPGTVEEKNLLIACADFVVAILVPVIRLTEKPEWLFICILIRTFFL